MLADIRKRLRNERPPLQLSAICVQSAGDESFKECPDFYKCASSSDGEKFVVPLIVDTVLEVTPETKYADFMSRLDRILNNRIDRVAQLLQVNYLFMILQTSLMMGFILISLNHPTEMAFFRCLNTPYTSRLLIQTSGF